MRAYHEELLGRGVRDYPLAALENAYQLAKLWVCYRMIMGIDLLDFQNERGAKLIDTWLERLSALLPPDYAARLDRSRG